MLLLGTTTIKMNIEDIVPELFGEKRVYYCQRCLNHGLREKRKNHKQNCAFSTCQCSDCIAEKFLSEHFISVMACNA
ncbi:DM DNA binding domain protein [Necator americanus]|uniref:DM DNA binding domain protein n=1 Tax=Necator americanus TaxID=51031 RepID=W2TP83_NECAM|nr:DM DNA binding domain protein [Necator americanus]ETN82946.1 DM DNA binding domain protein [Necator americanus]